jgi:hypothetical protein
MTASTESARVAFVILSAIFGLTIGNMFTDTILAASKNFAAQCEQIVGSNVKGLAIEPTYSSQQLCACARTNQEFRRQLGAAGIKCNATTITNFNQAVATPSDTDEPPTNEPAPKGNNGWANGAEGTNNGSNDGNLAQATSKTNESGSIGKNGSQGER